MSILQKILEGKRNRLSYSKSKISLTELKSRIKEIERPRNFQTAVKRDSGSIKMIAEIKKASPSKGLIRSNFDHKKIADVYAEKKADAISVVTEEDFFQGRLEFLADVKNIVSCPLLRKDFIFDEYQIYEARANHADAVLLIAAILERNQAGEYLHLINELGMSALFEVHDHEELEMPLRLEAPIIGINNRDLKTFNIDLETSIKLRNEVPAGRIVVAESGIDTRDDVIRLQDSKIDAVLIGTSFMKSTDIGRKMDELRGTK
jgi:indole-3-glycerol phosphate synthase